MLPYPVNYTYPYYPNAFPRILRPGNDNSALKPQYPDLAIQASQESNPAIKFKKTALNWLSKAEEFWKQNRLLISAGIIPAYLLGRTLAEQTLILLLKRKVRLSLVKFSVNGSSVRI